MSAVCCVQSSFLWPDKKEESAKWHWVAFYAKLSFVYIFLFCTCYRKSFDQKKSCFLFIKKYNSKIFSLLKKDPKETIFSQNINVKNTYFSLLGQQCNIKCPYRTYGQGCKERCNCQNGGNCDHISGACTCTPGWRGAL